MKVVALFVIFCILLTSLVFASRPPPAYCEFEGYVTKAKHSSVSSSYHVSIKTDSLEDTLHPSSTNRISCLDKYEEEVYGKLITSPHSYHHNAASINQTVWDSILCGKTKIVGRVDMVDSSITVLNYNNSPLQEECIVDIDYYYESAFQRIINWIKNLFS